jgi:hydroxylamine reductase (hybrid-cluster protein)
MKIDVLVAEIGSTTTVVNAVDLGGSGGIPRLLGQGDGLYTGRSRRRDSCA